MLQTEAALKEIQDPALQVSHLCEPFQSRSTPDFPGTTRSSQGHSGRDTDSALRRGGPEGSSSFEAVPTYRSEL